MVRRCLREIKRHVTRDWVIMEICGGQTHAIMRHGIDRLLPPEIELVHGPGCPVCITPLELIDKAVEIASLPNVIFLSYGDMLRVPGTSSNLLTVRANGGDVRLILSPLDAVKTALENPDKEIVFFAIGFETTTPANAMSVLRARELGLTNYTLLVSQVGVPLAIEAILSSPRNRVQGFLTAGHVNAVMGYWEYLPLVEKYQVPMAVTGFEPLDIVQGILSVIRQLEAGQKKVENAYPRAVTLAGNKPAQAAMKRVFENCDQNWRGIGLIPMSGKRLRPEYAEFDAENRFNVTAPRQNESALCQAGLILQGLIKPRDCEAFGHECTPQTPLGATMVSFEGSCSAYYHYGTQSTSSEVAHV